MAVVQFPGSKRGGAYEYWNHDEDAGADEDIGYAREDPDLYEDSEADDDLAGDPEDQDAESQERPGAGRRTALRWAVLVLLIGVVFAGYIYYRSHYGTYSGAVYSDIVETQISEGTQYLMLGNRIISYSRDGVSSMSRTGEQIYNVTFEMQQPLAAHNGDILALADYNGSTILLLTADEQLGTVNTSLPIRHISVSQDGEVAAVVDDQDVTWIYLYSSGGDTIAYFKTTMAQSGYPMDVAISPDGTLVAVSYLIPSDDGADSSIAFYNFGAVGANAVENNVSGFNYGNEIFPYLYFMNNSTCVAVSDTRIAFYTGDEIPQSGANVILPGQALGVYCSNKYLAILYADATGEQQYSMSVYGTNGSVTGEFSFTMDYSSIQIAGDRIYLNNAQECQIYTVSGKPIYSGTFQDNVRFLIPSATSNTRHYIVTDDTIETMRLE